MTAMREAIEQKIEAFRYAGPLANAHEDAVAKGFTDALEWVLTLLPASTPPGDAVAALNAALAQAFADDPANACRAHAAVLPILQQLSTPQPASDDPCVRHACKRVRMEMQARLDALAEVDDAMVKRALAATARPSLTCLTHENYVRAILDAAIKGDSHAG